MFLSLDELFDKKTSEEYRWVSVGQWIGQDKWVLERMKPVPEKLYKRDVGVIRWRQLAARVAKSRI